MTLKMIGVILLIMIVTKPFARYVFIKSCKYRRDKISFLTANGKARIVKLNRLIEWTYRN